MKLQKPESKFQWGKTLESFKNSSRQPVRLTSSCIIVLWNVLRLGTAALRQISFCGRRRGLCSFVFERECLNKWAFLPSIEWE